MKRELGPGRVCLAARSGWKPARSNCERSACNGRGETSKRYVKPDPFPYRSLRLSARPRGTECPVPDEDDELNEDLEDEEPSQQLDPNIRKQLRQARKISKERDEMSVRATTAERQLALLKAGIPADGVGELFAKAYDGPLEADAIKEEARKYGLLQEDATDEPASAELAAQQIGR